MKELRPFPATAPTNEVETLGRAVEETTAVMARGVDGVCLVNYAEAMTLHSCAVLHRLGYPLAASRLFEELRKGRAEYERSMAATIEYVDARSRHVPGGEN